MCVCVNKERSTPHPGPVGPCHQLGVGRSQCFRDHFCLSVYVSMEGGRRGVFCVCISTFMCVCVCVCVHVLVHVDDALRLQNSFDEDF